MDKSVSTKEKQKEIEHVNNLSQLQKQYAFIVKKNNKAQKTGRICDPRKSPKLKERFFFMREHIEI
jgi:hypothetical protein